MPEEFDPAWEYFEPDPEVSEHFIETGTTSGFDAVVTFEEYHNRRRPSGMRFGCGNPNRGWFRLAPEPPPRPEPEYRLVECNYCGDSFQTVASRNRVFCSRVCNGLSQRVSRTCPTCGTEFWSRTSKYCSRDCVPSRVVVRGWVPCLGCGTPFLRRTTRTMYCSQKCVVRTGDKLRLPKRHCEQCGRMFKPRRAVVQYCSRRCAARRRWRADVGLGPTHLTGGSQAGRELKVWIDRDVEYLTFLRTRGAPVDLCAERLVRSSRSVIGKLHRLGMVVQDHRSPRVARTQVRQLVDEGLSDTDIARRIRRTKRDVRYLRAQLGLKANPWKCSRTPIMLTPAGPPRPVVGSRVRIDAPLEEAVHGLEAVVEKLTDWGARLLVQRDPREYDTPGHVPRFRALWSEMILIPDQVGTVDARAMGYTGNTCPKCGSVRMVRTGACERCDECGDAPNCG